MKHTARATLPAKENAWLEKQSLLKNAAFPSPASSVPSSGPPSPERTTSPKRAPPRVSEAVASAHRRLRSSAGAPPSASAHCSVCLRLALALPDGLPHAELLSKL